MTEIAWWDWEVMAKGIILFMGLHFALFVFSLWVVERRIAALQRGPEPETEEDSMEVWCADCGAELPKVSQHWFPYDRPDEMLCEHCFKAWEEKQGRGQRTSSRNFHLFLPSLILVMRRSWGFQKSSCNG